MTFSGFVHPHERSGAGLRTTLVVNPPATEKPLPSLAMSKLPWTPIQSCGMLPSGTIDGQRGRRFATPLRNPTRDMWDTAQTV